MDKNQFKISGIGKEYLDKVLLLAASYPDSLRNPKTIVGWKVDANMGMILYHSAYQNHDIIQLPAPLSSSAISDIVHAWVMINACNVAVGDDGLVERGWVVSIDDSLPDGAMCSIRPHYIYCHREMRYE